ncbi:uncharacterized protein LOC130987430 isoform X2 [Salvia miltiorrhiza]|nr:uncharacterized protein LOC130987430 isoform X2 [Salvia miltiorrhiza]XP_057766953.1 uncharacterized protein LOC130987430 isoform X2 [Salvia miltiorrhiza]
MENHYSVMNRLMLRFRPIAPKPAGGDPDEHDGRTKYERRTKRKYVRVRGRQPTKMKLPDPERRSSPPGRSGVDDGSPPVRSAVTLQLLPERSESEKSTAAKFRDTVDPEQYRIGDEVSFKSNVAGVTTAGTWIVVERVTDTCVDGGVGLGYSDEEILMNLQADTCPGFVSDGANNVVWVNDACRRMAAAENGALVVRLMVREKLPYFTPSFACRVRMVQQTKQGQKWNKIVACDVWRMEFAAGFAWKLDVETALGLGV